LNINLTYGVAIVINKTMKQLLESSEGETINVEEYKSDNIGKFFLWLKTLDIKEEKIEFINNLGVDMKAWIEGFLEDPERFKEYQDDDRILPEVDLPKDGSIVTIEENVLRHSLNRLSRYAAQHDHSIEALILRMDILIEGMKLIKDVPIDLVGIRSYDLEREDEQKTYGSNFGLVVRTQNRANGKIIQVSFESQLVLSNHWYFPLEISPFNNKASRSSSTGSSKIIEIKPNKWFKVPLEWIIEDYCILYKWYENSLEKMSVLMYYIGSAMLKGSPNSPKIDFKSHCLNYKKDKNEDINFSLDLYAFKCKPYQMEMPLQFLLSFNPPLCFKNMLFGELSLVSKHDKNIVLKLKPQEYKYFYSQLVRDEDVKNKTLEKFERYSWKLQKDENFELLTKYDYLYNKSYNMSFNTLEFLQRKTGTTFDTEAVEICFEADDFGVRQNEYDNFKLREMAFTEAASINMLIYTPYMVINKTAMNFIIGSGGKRNDLQIRGNSSQYFNPRKEKKLFIKSDDYSWSREFSFKTIGVSGELSLKAAKPIQSIHPSMREYNSSEIDIGVEIATLSTSFYKTAAITIVPRYIIWNKWSDTLVISNDNKSSHTQIVVKKNQEKVI